MKYESPAFVARAIPTELRRLGYPQTVIDHMATAKRRERARAGSVYEAARVAQAPTA